MTNWAPPTRIAIGSVCLIASFAMSVITWVALGDIAGYGVMRYVMPAVVDTYIACSLITWLTVNDTTVATLARRNTYGAAVFGVLTQAVYHCAIMWAGDPTHPGHSIWRAGLALICGGIPPAGAFAAAHMIIRAARVTDYYTAQDGSGGADSHITQEVSAAGWLAASARESPLGPPPHVTGATTHPVDASTENRQPGTPTLSPAPTPPSVITAPTMPEQTATPETSPPTAEAPPPPAPAPATPARGSTAASGHSNTQWARGVTRPTQPRRGSVLSDEEWEQMDGWIDDGVRDFEIGKRMGRSEATVKKRRLERMARRAQRNGNERMVRR